MKAATPAWNAADPNRLAGAHLALIAGTFVVTFDFFVVNLALPAIAAALGSSTAVTQWIVAGFGLVYGAGLLVGSRLGERFGANRVYRAGLATFLAGSAACAFAGDAGTLVAARCLQGAGAALLTPQVMGELGRLVPDALRLRAFAGYGVALGLGSGLGQVAGGLLVDPNALDLGWRACFLVNVPIGLAAMVAARPPAHRAAQRPQPVDGIGAAMLFVALFALLTPIIEGRRLGWPAWLALPAVAALLLLGAFAWRQVRRHRRGASLLVDPRAFDGPMLRRALLTVFLFYCANASFFYVVSLYFQDGRGFTPLESAGVFSIMIVAFLATSFTGRRIAARLGASMLPAGSMLMALGHAALGALIFADAPVVVLVPALLATGAGVGVVMGPLVARAIAAAEPRHTALAAGLVGSAQWIGNAVGVAIIGSVYLALASTGDPADASRAAATSHWSFALIGVIVAFAIPRWRPWSEQA